MPARSNRAVARKASKPAAKVAVKGLGRLPEWDLSALYAGIDDPAVKRDLDRADRYSIAFEEDFKGKLAALADGPDAGKQLAEAVKRYEQLDDLLGTARLLRRPHPRAGTRSIRCAANSTATCRSG